VELERAQQADSPQLGLFDQSFPLESTDFAEREDPLRDAVNALDPDRLSPREALDALYRLKDLADRK